jgi:hypothetical protein
LILLLLVYTAADGVLELLPPLVLTSGISVAVLEWLIRRARQHQIWRPVRRRLFQKRGDVAHVHAR